MSSVAPFLPKHPDSYGSHILHQTAEQQQKSRFTDFVLSSQGQEIHCHKNVLAASCPYFSAMFSSNMNEMQQGKAVMDNIKFSMLKGIVQFLYAQCVSILWDDVDDLLEACEMMQLNELKAQLEDYVADNITAENCIRWWKLAENFNLERAGAKAKLFMASAFEEVSKSQDFMRLTYAELLDYLRNDEVRLPNQDQVLFAGIRWVAADVDERKREMLDVLTLVKLSDCSSGAIDDMSKSQCNLLTDPDVKNFVYGVVLSRLANFEQKHSEKHGSLLVLGGMSRYDGMCYTECWRSCGRLPEITWELITNIPKSSIGKQPSYVCFPSGFAIICGGESGTVNAKYDVQNQVWTDLPPTPGKLTDTVALHTDGKIHVLDGGKYSADSKVLTDRMLTLNLHNLKWNEGPALLEKQYHPIATAHEHSLWAVYNDNAVKTDHCTLQSLSPGASRWVYKASLPDDVRTGGASIVGFKGSLFLGGTDKKPIMHYNIAINQWTEVKARPSISHFYGSICVLEEKIFLCGGGWRGSQVTDCIEEYDPDFHQWKKSSLNLPKPLTFFTIASC